MNRLAAILLLVGGVLLISWAVAPAAPPPATAQVPAPEVSSGQIAQTLDADVARLRGRLDPPPAFPAPSRDPFRYGRRTELVPPAPVIEAPATVELPAALLPKLLAILSDNAEDGRTYRAVVAVGAEVTVVKAGEAAGPLRVQAITAGTVELIDPATLQIFRLILK